MGKTQELPANDMRISRLYLQSLLEKATFKPGYDFIVEAREGVKAPVSICIYVPARNTVRLGTLNDLKNFLDANNIMNEPGRPNSFHLYVKYVDIVVPESFKENLKNQAGLTRAENNGHKAETEEENIFAPL